MTARTRILSSLAILFGVGLVACDTDDDPPPFAPAPESLAARLEKDLGARVYLDETPGRPYATTTTPARVIASGATRGDAVRTFLAPYASDLGLDPEGLEVASEGDDLGGLHHVVVRSKTAPRDLVRADGVDVTTDADGRFVAFAGSLSPSTMAKGAMVAPEAAKSAALASLPGASFVAMELGTYAADGTTSARDAVLAFRVRTSAADVWVDATTGAIAGVDGPEEGILAPSVESVAWDPTETLYRENAKKEVRVTEVGDHYELRGNANVAGTGSEIAVASLVGWNGTEPRYEAIVSKNPAAWDDTTPAYQGSYLDGATRVPFTPSARGIAPRSAVDAFDAVAKADGFFRKYLFRGPLDGSRIQVVVHANFRPPTDPKRDELGENGQNGRNNAYFNHATQAIFFGDGSYFYSEINRSLPSTRILPYTLSLDVVGHELSHAMITRFMAARGEAGAINEGIADVIGLLFERENDPESRADTIGERSEPDSCFRNLANPLLACRPSVKKLPVQSATVQTQGCVSPSGVRATPTPANDYGCVHQNATIVGNAFWLMAYGGENPVTHVSISKPVSETTARTLGLAVHGLVSLRSAAVIPATYAALARYQIDLTRVFSPAEANTVACAWYAVGAIDGRYTKAMGFVCEASPPAGCVGREDGWYCDESIAFSANLCRGGSVASGNQCASGYHCVTTGGTRRAALSNGLPRCAADTNGR